MLQSFSDGAIVLGKIRRGISCQRQIRFWRKPHSTAKLVIVFGIGNPGKKYEKTRHNLGFLVIDRLRVKGLEFRVKSSVMLIKPRTFVNNSGISAKRVLLKYNVNPEDFLVVVDDFNLHLDEIRFRKNGSSGGHKGLKSIIEEIGTKAFPRLRIGIGPLIGDAAEFVLSPFEEQEISIIEESIDKACLVIESFITEGIDKAMEICNKVSGGDS